MARVIRVTARIDFAGDFTRAQAVESLLLQMEDVVNIDVTEEEVTEETERSQKDS
jgi:hypothetical protein